MDAPSALGGSVWPPGLALRPWPCSDPPAVPAAPAPSCRRGPLPPRARASTGTGRCQRSNTNTARNTGLRRWGGVGGGVPPAAAADDFDDDDEPVLESKHPCRMRGCSFQHWIVIIIIISSSGSSCSDSDSPPDCTAAAVQRRNSRPNARCPPHRPPPRTAPPPSCRPSATAAATPPTRPPPTLCLWTCTATTRRGWPGCTRSTRRGGPASPTPSCSSGARCTSCSACRGALRVWGGAGGRV